MSENNQSNFPENNFPETPVDAERLRPILAKAEELLEGIVEEVEDLPLTEADRGTSASGYRSAFFPSKLGGSVKIAQSIDKNLRLTTINSFVPRYQGKSFELFSVEELEMIEVAENESFSYGFHRYPELHSQGRRLSEAQVKDVRLEAQLGDDPELAAALHNLDALYPPEMRGRLTEARCKDYEFKLSQLNKDERVVLSGYEGVDPSQLLQ